MPPVPTTLTLPLPASKLRLGAREVGLQGRVLGASSKRRPRWQSARRRPVSDTAPPGCTSLARGRLGLALADGPRPNQMTWATWAPLSHAACSL